MQNSTTWKVEIKNVEHGEYSHYPIEDQSVISSIIQKIGRR